MTVNDSSGPIDVELIGNTDVILTQGFDETIIVEIANLDDLIEAMRLIKESVK